MLDNKLPQISGDHHRPATEYKRPAPANIRSRNSLSLNRAERFEMGEPKQPSNAPSQSRTVRAANLGDPKFQSQFQMVLQILWKASQTAYLHRRPDWDFAIEISDLTKLGISRHLLRVMVCEGAVERRREVTIDGQETRSFVPETGMVLSDQSCFVLSQLGKNQIDEMSLEKEKLMKLNSIASANGVKSNGLSSKQVPVWDTTRRELRLGDIVIKRFKWPAANQEQILRAFQEEGWPDKIDDPLPPNPKICPKRRLHDTIKCLNRRQVNSAIKFRGDGTGQGVVLEIRSTE